MLGVVGSSLKMVKFEPTCRNRVAKRTQHVAPNNVAIFCVGMLRSFGRGLMDAIFRVWYNGSYTVVAKPIKTLELHYTMIQLLLIHNNCRNSRALIG